MATKKAVPKVPKVPKPPRVKKPKAPLPVHVLQAKLRGDTEALSAMGRAGNRKAAVSRKQQDFHKKLEADLLTLKSRLDKEELAELRQKELEKELHERAIAENQHLAKLDPDDPEIIHTSDEL